MFRDVTERKRMEEELRKSRERYELAVLASQDGLWDWDLEADEIYRSPRYLNMLGYEEHEWGNKVSVWRDHLHPDDYESRVAAEKASVAGLTPYLESEYRLRQKDGTYRWVRVRGVALRDSKGKAYRMAGSIEDISERKLAEQALRNSEAQYRALADAIPQMVWTASPDAFGGGTAFTAVTFFGPCRSTTARGG